MSTYAKSTDVTADRSRSEVERTLERYGATGYMYGWQDDQAMIGFRMEGRQIRIALPMPQLDEFRLTESGRVRTPTSRRDAWEQAKRQRWRALALYVKAKLEAIESDIVTFETAFLPHIVLPDGRTVAEVVGAELPDVFRTGQPPSLLPLSPASAPRQLSAPRPATVEIVEEAE